MNVTGSLGYVNHGGREREGKKERKNSEEAHFRETMPLYRNSCGLG